MGTMTGEAAAAVIAASAAASISGEPKVASGIVKSASSLGDQFVDLLAGDDQRRTDHHRFTHGADDEAMLKASVAAVDRRLLGRLEECLACWVPYQLQRAEQPFTAKFAHDRVGVRKLLESRPEIGCSFLSGALDQPFARDDVDVALGHRAGNRVA